MAVIHLSHGSTHATIRPSEGGAMDSLTFEGHDILATTPWHVPGHLSIARTETEWIEQWRGGWQLCFPTTGQADGGSTGFHGAASQAPWQMMTRSKESVRLSWNNPELDVTRIWRVSASGVEVHTRCHALNPTEVMVAEHLILGTAFVGSATEPRVATLASDGETAVSTLDLDGTPRAAARTLSQATWDLPGIGTGSQLWAVTPSSRLLTVSTRELQARIEWSEALPHALVWEETGAAALLTDQKPMRALGVEPTSSPHGAGPQHGGTIALGRGEDLEWTMLVTLENLPHATEVSP